MHRRLLHPLLLASLLTASAGLSGKSQAASTEQLAAEMSQRITAIGNASAVNGVIPRFNQAKSLGCFDAAFRVHDNLDPAFKHGLFSHPATYPARLRFANASEQDDSEKDLRGLSIKVLNVEGQPLWGQAGVQDFLLNSYPALFVATPEAFLAFIKARQEDAVPWFFFNPLDSHLKSLWTLIQAREAHRSPFEIRYWSTTPFQLGESAATAVKYSVTPCAENALQSDPPPGANQLRSAMSMQLDQGPACFEFGVQPRTHADDMPIEDASVIWDEDLSPFHTVATITILPQAFDTPDAMARCENISFNPWQSLPEHRPLGRMNEVRREVYIKASEHRLKGSP